MKLIIGLGNPGVQYKTTRHNVGFMAVDLFAELEKLNFQQQFNALICKTRAFIVLKPQTYMNLSGDAVAEVMNYYKISNEDILVIYDDVDLPLGKLRLRENGGSGGHNGIKSIIAHIGEDFKRLRIGIDRPLFGETSDHVLGSFSQEQINIINSTLKTVSGLINHFLGIPFPKLMSMYN